MNRFVYLASASPRRRELLAQLGLDCEVLPVNVDETSLPGEAPGQYVSRLALAKARAVDASALQAPAPVIAADTTVVLDGDILGKPRGEADACAMLCRLGGQVHEVYTAVAAKQAAHEVTALSCSTVRFRDIDADEARAYWGTGEPRDKAGAYGIQGIAAIFVERLEGSYSGVMGLPLFETARLLQSLGLRVLEPQA
ncbi:MAG: Maf family protein [Gammaproteobacteria bacterium]|nr:Maf family protein [Gammaproteobacteria bacterium]